MGTWKPSRIDFQQREKRGQRQKQWSSWSHQEGDRLVVLVERESDGGAQPSWSASAPLSVHEFDMWTFLTGVFVGPTLLSVSD